MSTEFSISYELPGSGVGGRHQEVVNASSESEARRIVRMRFGDRDVRVVESHMIRFGGGRDDHRDDRR